MADAGHLITAIEDVARRRPDAPAVLSTTTDGTSALSYGQLVAAMATERAYLRSAGVGSGDRVAVIVDRTIDAIISMLGVISVGAIAVPLDPAFPAERWKFMVADSGAIMIRGTIPECLAGIDAGLASGERADHDHDPASTTAIAAARGLTPAVMLYTSGTTGRPKGVVLSHEGLLGHMLSYAGRVELTAADRILQFCSPSCDISLAETFIPLVTGGSLVLRPIGSVPSAGELVDIIAATSTTWLDLPCAYWQHFGQMGRALPSTVRAIVIGGDRITAADVAVWSAGPNRTVRLFNGYGPTESSITTMMHEIRMDSTVDPPIGTPLDHIGVSLVTDDGRTAEVGEVGELVVSGRGVAIGYHRRPDDAARQFTVPVDSPGDTTYATGDRVRVDEDGIYHFVGRVDDQIKIAGFRVEAQEVESLARDIVGIRRAVAVTRGQSAGERSLGLYLEVDPSDDRSTNASEDAAHDPATGSLDRSLVDGWRAIYDDNARTAEITDARFNIHGWRNSIDNAPIPPVEMRQWVNETIRLIAASPHDDVLEIGCGTGLLLHPLAPNVARYVGTDFSAETLAVLAPSLDQEWNHVALHCCEATDVSEVDGQFDIVVINSVTQHFPSETYLRDAVGAAVSKCRAGGRVIVGDVRGLHLLTAFHADVLAQRHGIVEVTDEMMDEARAEAAGDEELVVAPQWFAELARRDDRLTHVTLTPKGGTAHNEMVRFRFDVVLHVGTAAARPVDRWVPWGEVRSLEMLQTFAVTEGSSGERVGIVAIANARLTPVAGGGAPGVMPHDVRNVVAKLGLHAELSWLASGDDGSFDVVISHDGEPADFSPLASRWAGEKINEPLRVSLERSRRTVIIDRVRTRLRDHLPKAVVPSLIEVVDDMPMTPGGKIDRVELGRRAQPSTASERVSRRGGTLLDGLVVLAAEILGHPELDGETDFFAAGGTSLGAMRLLARIRVEHGVELSPSAVFEAGTMSRLAISVGQASYAGSEPERRVDREAPVPLTATQQRLWLANDLDDHGGASLIIPSMSVVDAAITPSVFEQACRQVVQRHECLRARIIFDGTEPGQRFDVDPARVAVDRLYAPDVSVGQHLAAAWSFVPFDIETGPLVRFLLVELGDGSSLVAVSIHHIVADASSLRIVVDEVITHSLGDRVDDADAVLDFGDVAVWERFRSRTTSEAEREAWVRALQLPQPSSLPVPSARPLDGRAATITSPQAKVDCVEIPAAVLDGVDRVASEIGTTRFVVLLAAHLVAVARAAGERTVATAIPVSGRNAMELEGVVGPLINLVVAATTLDPDSSTASAVRSIHDTFVGALGRQRLPYTEICNAAPSSWSRSERQLVDAMVQYLDVPVVTRVAGSTVTPLDDPGLVTRFGLEVIFEHREGAVRLRLTSSPDHIGRHAVRAHGASIVAALGAMPDLLGRPLAHLLDIIGADTDSPTGYDAIDGRIREIAGTVTSS